MIPEHIMKQAEEMLPYPARGKLYILGTPFIDCLREKLAQALFVKNNYIIKWQTIAGKSEDKIEELEQEIERIQKVAHDFVDSNAIRIKKYEDEIERLKKDLAIADEVLHYRHDYQWKTCKEIQELQKQNNEMREALERISKSKCKDCVSDIKAKEALDKVGEK